MNISHSSGAHIRNNPNNCSLTEEFLKHRLVLKQTVHQHLDRRLHRRLDASDILQETFIEASRRFEKFLATRPMQIRDWLRVIARNITRNANAFHVTAGKRSLRSEKDNELAVANKASSLSSPSHKCVRKELMMRKQECLSELSHQHREVIRLRHDFSMSNKEISIQLGITQKAASKRYLTALASLRKIMETHAMAAELDATEPLQP